MNIGRRMVSGFTILIALGAVIGVIGIIQINNLNTSITDLTQNKMESADFIMEAQLSLQEMIIMIHQYEDNETEGVESGAFGDAYTGALTFLEGLKVLNPENTATLTNFITQVTLVNTLAADSNGIFDLMDSYNLKTEEILLEDDQIDNNLDTLIMYQNNSAMIANATEVKYDLEHQILIVFQYFGTQSETGRAALKAEFQTAINDFDSHIDSVINNGNGTALANSIETWHNTDFLVLITTASTGIFDVVDLLRTNDEQVETVYDLVFNGLVSLEVIIQAQMDQAVNNANITATSSFIILVSILIASVSVGAIVAIPTVRGIVRVTDNMEEILKVSTDISVNVSNIATELAASASEVNAASEEIASTTQDISRDSQIVLASSDNISGIMDAITMISEQTNLLALNASIEAGRAGEYGRGFAVVADEVRKLAEESKKTVSNTNEKVREIINRIQATTASMEGISASTEEQTASMEEVTATANKLGVLASELTEGLMKWGNGKSNGSNHDNGNGSKRRRFLKAKPAADESRRNVYN